MQRLLYISSAAKEFVEKNILNKLAQQAVQRNIQNDITGALFYSGGHFLQLLEGPSDALSETFLRIKADPRHFDLEVLFLEDSNERIFPDWGMSSNCIEFKDEPPNMSLAVTKLKLAVREKRIKSCSGAIEYFIAPSFAGW